MSMSFDDPLTGGTVLRRPAIQSPNFVHNTSGWTINIDGSAEFNNLTIRGTFNGTDFIINSAGAFFYSGTPALGNLIASITTAAGTDQFGNVYLAGNTSYVVLNLVGQQNGTYAVTSGLAPQNGFPAFFLKNLSVAGANSPPGMNAQQGSLGGFMIVYSGQGTGNGTPSQIQLSDSQFAGVAGGTIILACGVLSLGASAAASWNDNAQTFTLPAAGGPFIQGEGFHNVGLAAGWAGQLRVKKLPWNMIHFNCQINATTATAGGVSIAFGSLPDSTYYPFFSSHQPVALTGAAVLTSGSFLGTPRWNIPNAATGGAIHLEIPSLSASALITISCDVVYPTN